MTTRTFTIGTDNFQFRLNKQDKTNTDEVELVLPTSTAIEVYDEVILRLTNTTVFFRGLVQNVRLSNGSKVCKVWDYGSELLTRTVNTIYTNQSPEAIIQDVLTNYTTLTYVSTISSGLTITYQANKKRAWDVVTEMAELLLANFYVDYNKNFMLEIEGDATITSKNINTNNAKLDGAWLKDIEQVYNSITIDGDDRQLFERDPELFDGDNSTTEFVLAEIPSTIKVEHPVGTILTGYAEGVTTGDYQLDRANKKIIFDIAPTTGTNNIQVTYSVSVPVSVRRSNTTSISLYGQRDKTFKKTYIKTRDEARKYAEYAINRYKDPLEESVWILNPSEVNDINTYLPNKYIFVDDQNNNKSGYYIIREIMWEHPGQFKVKVGTPVEDIIFWQKEIQQKVKQLEESDDNSTILTEDEYVQEEMTMQFDVDVVNVIKRTFDSDTFYLSETSITRNQMVEAGTGPVMREIADGNGYTDADVDTLNDELLLQSGDNFLLQNGDYLLISSSTFDSIGVVSIFAQNTARNNLLNYLTTTLSHVAVGDSTTTPTTSDTTLGNETTRETVFNTPMKIGNGISFTLFLDLTENNGNTINETGVFDDVTSGNMYTHSLTTTISKDATKEVFVDVNVLINTENTILN